MIVILLSAYLIGSVPFAWILARAHGAPDLRRVGSGNVGAANVLRTSGVTAGVLVVLLDAAKGAASVLLAGRIDQSGVASVAAGLAAVLGHMYPVWLRFRGGKGVATACGVFSLLTPIAAGSALGLFVVTVWVTRYVSLGSVIASVALPLIAYGSGSPRPVVTAAVIAAVAIVVRHRSNLVRLRHGVERRIGMREPGRG